MKYINSKLIAIFIGLCIAFIFITSFKSMILENENEKLTFKIAPNVSNNYEVAISDSTISHLDSGAHANINTYQFNNLINLIIAFLPQESNGSNSILVVNSYMSNIKSSNDFNSTFSVNNVRSDPYQKSLKAFDGSEFYVNLDKTGKVTRISGYKEFQRKFQTIYLHELSNIKDDDERPAFPSNDGILFREPYFIDLIERISGNLPDFKVSVNSKWEKLESKDIGGEKYIRTAYTCYKIENGIAYIKSYANVDEPFDLNDPSNRMKGIEEGEIEIDAYTGLLIKSEKKLTMYGETIISRSKFSITKIQSTIINKIGTTYEKSKFKDSHVLTGVGTTIKEVPLSNVTDINLHYEFFKDADELSVEDQDGNELFATGLISTNEEQYVTIRVVNVSKLIFKIKSVSTNSRWRLKIEY